MYCEHCGRQIPDEATFCQYCGQKVILLPAQPETEGHGWYYIIGSEEKGPVNERKMRQFVEEGRVRPSTLVRRGGMMGWRQAKETELFKGIYVDEPPEWNIKNIIVAACAALIGIMLFFDWFSAYVFKISIIEFVKIEGSEVSFGLVLLAIAASVTLILCIFTVTQILTSKRSSMGAGIGAVVTFVCSLFALLFEDECKLTFAPYMVLFLGIILIIVYKCMKE